MDYTIGNTAKLFDQLLAVLNKHSKDPGAIEALEYLRAARNNYVNRSIDHMTNCLILTIQTLVAHPPSEALQEELKSVINSFVMGIFQTGSKLSELAHKYEESGGTLLSPEAILAEVDETRGLAT